MFENPLALSKPEILAKLGYKITQRQRITFLAKNKKTNQRFELHLQPKLGQIIQKSLKNNEEWTFNFSNYSLQETDSARKTLCREYGFYSITFPNAHQPTYLDVRALNLPLEQFEGAVQKLELNLIKIGLIKPEHISRLCQPMKGFIHSEELS